MTNHLPPNYHHFCEVISKGPATPMLETVSLVMALSNGEAHPDIVCKWWHQWQALRQAMKDNHPMVKLAAALAPSDPTPAPITGTAAQMGARDPSAN